MLATLKSPALIPGISLQNCDAHKDREKPGNHHNLEEIKGLNNSVQCGVLEQEKAVVCSLAGGTAPEVAS